MNKAEAETLAAVYIYIYIYIMFIRKKYIIAEETKLIKNYKK